MMRPRINCAVVFLVNLAFTYGEVKFEAGQAYTYEYTSEVSAHSKGVWSSLTADEIASILTVETKARVTVQELTSPFEYLLTVNDGELSTRTFADNAQEGPAANVKIPDGSIKFTYVDGMITSTYIDPSEPTWSANIKRGILSLLQNNGFSATMDKAGGVEESVLGQCMTMYETTSESGDNVYTKKIFLNQCGLSEGSDIISQGVPYQMPLVVNKPLLGFVRGHASVVECRQVVSDKSILTSAVCEDKVEESSMMRFPQKSSLVFKSSAAAAAVPGDEVLSKLSVRSSSLVYDFETSSYSNAEGEKTGLEKLKVLLGNEDFDMTSKDELSFFNDFKTLIPKVSDLSELKELLGKSPRKKVFYDAAAEVVSDGAISLLVEGHKANDLDIVTRMSFYNYLPFVSKPGVKALEGLTELVKDLKVPTEPETRTAETVKHFEKDVSMAQHLLLGVSGAAYRFCVKTDASCGSNAEYTELVKALASHVKEAAVESGEMRVSHAAVYSLGNLNVLTDEGVKKLETLISGDGTSNVVKLAGLDGFRRSPCESRLKEVVRSKLVDKMETDEIRIHAYLALVKCLTPEDISAVKGVLDETENNLVKGYIASHIKNIMASSSPSTAGMRSSLSGVEVPVSTSSIQDMPRASKFMEHSTFRQKENVGFSGSMSVIFSPGQVNPQFVSINKTIDIFGRSYNFLEVGLSQRMIPTNRRFHDDSEPPNWGSVMLGMSAEDSYVRVFGTTVAMGMGGIDKAMQMAFFKISNGTILMDLIHPATLLDEKISTSTVTGLPVTFGLDATYLKALQLEMSSEPFVKLTNSLFALDPEQGQDVNLKMNIKLHGSASGVASVSIGGESCPVRIGYAVESRMDKKYSWGVEAKTSRSVEETLVEFKLNLPDKTIASKEIKGRVYNFQEVNGVSVATESTAVSTRADMDTLVQCDTCKVLGIRSCANVTKPGNYKMLPVYMTVSLDKVEEALTGFVVSVKSIRGKINGDNVEGSQSISITTPGSSTPRELNATFKHTTSVSRENGRPALSLNEYEVNGVLGESKFHSVLKVNDTPTSFDLYHGVAVDSQPMEEIVHVSTFYSEPNGETTLNVTFGKPLHHLVENFTGVHRRESRFVDEGGNERFSFTQVLKAKLASRLAKDPSFEAVYKDSAFIDNSESKMRSSNSMSVLDVKVGLGDEAVEVTLGTKYTGLSQEQSSEYTYKYYTTYEDNTLYSGELRLLTRDQVRDKHGFVLSSGYNRALDYSRTNSNASLSIDSSCLPYPIISQVDVEVRGDHTNGTMDVTSNNEDKKWLAHGKFELAPSASLYSMEGVVTDVTDFRASVAVPEGDGTKGKTHVHLDINILPCQTSISADVDMEDDGNVLNEVTSAVVKNAKKGSVVVSNSTTYLNRAERRFSYQSSATDQQKGSVLASFKMEGQAQPSFESSGVSRLSWDYSDIRGAKCRGTMNKTLTISSPIYKVLKETEVFAGKGPEAETPFRLTTEMTYDATVQPEYSAQGHLSLVEKISSSSLQFDMSRDLSWFVKRDTPVAGLNAETNFTLNGEKSSTLVVGEWKGDAGDPTKGQVSVVGKVKDRKFGGEGDFKISYEGDVKTLQTVRCEGEVFSTDDSSGEKTTVMTLNVTQSVEVPHAPYMTAVETGSLGLPTLHTEYVWDEELSVQKRDFVFHKDVKVFRDGVEMSEEEVLIHLSVHVRDDEHQKRVMIRTDHNFNPTCPLRQMNLTLSR